MYGFNRKLFFFKKWTLTTFLTRIIYGKWKEHRIFAIINRNISTSTDMSRLFSVYFLLLLGTLMHAQEHNFEFISNHIYLNAEVNGKPARLVFDTGSTDVYLDSTWLSESGIKYQQMGIAMVRGVGNEAKRTTLIFSGVCISMNGKKYTPQMVPVIDLLAILGDKANGIFGLKYLMGKVITINYKNGKLTLSDKLTKDQIEGFTRIPIETDKNHPGRILIPIEVSVTQGKVISGKALLDTGSGQGLEFTSKAAAKYGLDKIEDKVHFHYEYGGVGGESAGYEFGIEKATTGNLQLFQGKARYSTDNAGAMSSDKYIAILGNDIWQHFTLIIDLSNSELYLKENL